MSKERKYRKYRTTPARRKANKKWARAHKTKARKISYRSTAKTYIRTYANRRDLIDLQNLIQKYLELK